MKTRSTITSTTQRSRSGHATGRSRKHAVAPVGGEPRAWPCPEWVIRVGQSPDLRQPAFEVGFNRSKLFVHGVTYGSYIVQYCGVHCWLNEDCKKCMCKWILRLVSVGNGRGLRMHRNTHEQLQHAKVYYVLNLRSSYQERRNGWPELLTHGNVIASRYSVLLLAKFAFAKTAGLRCKAGIGLLRQWKILYPFSIMIGGCGQVIFSLYRT